MKTVGMSEARRRFASLLREVESGETVVITRRGMPVARLVGLDPDQAKILKTIEDIRDGRKGQTLGGLSIRDLINEGRR